LDSSPDSSPLLHDLDLDLDLSIKDLDLDSDLPVGDLDLDSDLLFRDLESSPDSDSLCYWENAAQLERIKPAVWRIMSVPASSAPVERVFSYGGIFMRPHRASCQIEYCVL